MSEEEIYEISNLNIKAEPTAAPPQESHYIDHQNTDQEIKENLENVSVHVQVKYSI